MAAKSKIRERRALAPIHPVKSLVLRDVTPPIAAPHEANEANEAHAVSRRRPVVTPTRSTVSRSARS